MRGLLDELQNIAADVTRVEREEEAAHRVTEGVEAEGAVGVYVYSLPHYLRYPYDPDSGHTLYKVGHSKVDVFSRVTGQGRTTALPEDPVLVRVYRTGNASSDEEERHFHDWLEVADHARSLSSKGGREWFLTTTKFLDRIARQRIL